MDGPNYVHPERHGSDAMMDGGMRKAFGAGDEKVMIWFSCFGHFDPKPNPTPPPLFPFFLSRSVFFLLYR